MRRASGDDRFHRSIHGTTEVSLKYSHLVDVDAGTRKLIIHRVYPDGRKELFTQVDLPAGKTSANEKLLDEFCRMLGENLLLDSPVARKLLHL